jgi:phosphoribosylformylglycinamidine synthase
VRLQAESSQAAGARVDSMCDRLLANPVIETYRFEIEEVVPA